LSAIFVVNFVDYLRHSVCFDKVSDKGSRQRPQEFKAVREFNGCAKDSFLNRFEFLGGFQIFQRLGLFQNTPPPHFKLAARAPWLI